MGCGCNKNKGVKKSFSNSRSSTPSIKNVINKANARKNTVAGPVHVNEIVNDKKRVDKLRREAIRRALGM